MECALSETAGNSAGNSAGSGAGGGGSPRPLDRLSSGRPGSADRVEEDFDDFVRANQAGLVRYATLLSGSLAQAEDIVQDVLARLYPRWDRLVSRGAVLAYARRSVTNEYLSWRRRWATRHIHLAEPADLHGEPVDPWGGGRDEELWQRLLRLPPQQRSAVVLRYYEDLDDAEIAEVLGCRASTVRSNISRGLASLRNQPEHRGGRDV